MSDDKDKDSEFEDLFDDQKGPKEDDVHNKGKPKPDSGDGSKKPEESPKEDSSWHDNDDVEKIKKLCDELNSANKKLAEVSDELRRLKVDNAHISELNGLFSEAKGRQDELLSKLVPANFNLAKLLRGSHEYALDLLRLNIGLRSENDELARSYMKALALVNYECGKRIGARARFGLACFLFGAVFASLIFWFFWIHKL